MFILFHNVYLHMSICTIVWLYIIHKHGICRCVFQKFVTGWVYECVCVFWVREQSNPFSPQWYGETLLSCCVSHTHKHRGTLKYTSCCHAVLHGVVITLTSAGPYTLIHLYSILCRFPSHIHSQANTQTHIHNIGANGSLDGLAEMEGSTQTHKHTKTH